MSNILFLNDALKPNPNSLEFFKRVNIVPGNYTEDLNRRLHNTLIALNDTAVTSITIPLNVVDHFLNLSGLTLAHHIRLTDNLNFKHVPIFVYGVIPLDKVLRLSSLSRILLTDNVIYKNISECDFTDVIECIKNHEFKERKTDLFLQQIQVQPPSDYNSHHSIDNEFALVQWSKALNCYDALPSLFKDEYESQLYFKYLRMIHKNENKYEINIDIKKILEFKIKTKVLLIDDDSIKGWGVFYRALFNGSNVEFKDSEIDFKGSKKEEIIEAAKNVVSSFKPDILFLDLRLHDSDFVEDITPDNLTGLQILEEVKKFDRGIQVIIITASNKAWNYKNALKYKAYDYIVKDGSSEINDVLNDLSKNILICYKRALFLKSISKKVNQLISLIEENPLLDTVSENKKDNQILIKDKLVAYINIAYELLEDSFEYIGKEKHLAYSYLQFFICIEELLSVRNYFQGGDRCFVNNDILVAKAIKADGTKELLYNSSIELVKKSKNNLSHYKMVNSKVNNVNITDFKMAAVLIHMFGNTTSNVFNWPSVRDVRNNKTAHIERGQVKKDEIINLLDFLIYIFDIKSINTINRDKGLSMLIDNYDIDKLREHDSFKIIKKKV
ncbi:MAG: response regulator [Sphingomonadales bacterium]|jgi:DNA-binding NarL/FixJ family response regulator